MKRVESCEYAVSHPQLSSFGLIWTLEVRVPIRIASSVICEATKKHARSDYEFLP